MNQTNKAAAGISTSKVFIPITIGLLVVGWMFWREFDVKSFVNIDFTWTNIGFILLAGALIVFRDFWLVVRFRMMTNQELSWKQGFRVNTLKEFASTVMPTTIGGGGLIILFLNREGINAGRSTTIAMVNLFLDNLYLILGCLIIFLFIPFAHIFNSTTVVASSISVVFWVVFPILCIWNLTLHIGLFHRPQLIARFFRQFFRLPFLKRFQAHALTFGDNLIEASVEIKKKSFTFWLRAFGATTLSWSARFLVVNALFLAFDAAQGKQLIIFVRQIIIFVAMVVSPTPGGSGLSEIAFKGLYSDLTLGIGPMLVIICAWRVITYYTYLLLGVVITPRWIRRSFGKKEQQ